MTQTLRILIVEDSEDDALLLLRELQRGGFEAVSERVETAGSMRAALDRQEWDLIVADYTMPYFSGVAALQVLLERGLDIPFIFVSGTIGEETAIAAMKAGASDYVLKNDLTRLVPAIRRDLREAEDRRQRRRAEEALRRSEEQLRQAQKLEAIGRLAGGIAHDFNNLLTVILGHSDMLLYALPPGHLLREDLEAIRTAGERAAALTRQLLAFSRRQQLQPRVLDLNAVVLNMDRMLRRLIGEHIELETKLDANLGKVRADENQLEQVILNLAVNARDAMPKGGQLLIETSNKEWSADAASQAVGTPTGAFVQLAVSDTGSGMDAATQARLFEPFFTTKEPGKGTGLGLATVYGIVQQSGGHIHVYSELGLGSTFRIYLPHVDETGSAPRTSAIPAEPSKGTETILLVEDAEEVRTLATRVLELHGYRVLAASKGEEALRIAEAHSGSLELLITDLVMPGVDGRRVAEEVANLRPGIKALFISGYTERGIATLPPGAAFLEKPFVPHALVQKVREVLDAPPGS